jgi:hypothetical protein
LMWGRSLGLLFFLLAGSEAARAATKAVSAGTFSQQIAAARQLVTSCAGTASLCDGAALPDREQVQGTPGGDFSVDWSWLRSDLAAAKGAKPADRLRRMNASQMHLAALLSQAGADHNLSSPEFRKARTAANAALARGEFQADGGPGWMERQGARLQDWLLRIFTGMDRVGRRAPWLAPLIEWSCFALAAGGLLWFVRQSLARQALRIALSEGAALASRNDREAADWARLADEHAAAQNWREAVHCLYWAAIALLERRRAWRPNATRTPREYVRLLRPGTEAYVALRDLTRGFERIWYGQATADEAQYRSAKDRFQALEAAKPERQALDGDRAGATPAALTGGI